MISPCRSNKCGLREADKNNWTCMQCPARAAIALGEEWTDFDIPSEPIPEPPPTSPSRKRKKKKPIKAKASCTKEGCSRPVATKGLCRACYQRDRYWRLKKQKAPSRPKIKPASKKPPLTLKKPRLRINLMPGPFLSESDVVKAVNKLTQKHGVSIEKLAVIVQAEAIRRLSNA